MHVVKQWVDRGMKAIQDSDRLAVAFEADTAGIKYRNVVKNGDLCTHHCPHVSVQYNNFAWVRNQSSNQADVVAYRHCINQGRSFLGQVVMVAAGQSKLGIAILGAVSLPIHDRPTVAKAKSRHYHCRFRNRIAT